MKENYKLERELLFKNNIREITTISLDSDYKVSNNFISGNFVISGEYKIHEVSINKEKFNFKIPFNHKIKEDIDDNTVNIEITNFIYDYQKDELIVNIDYDVIGSRKDVLLFDDEESLDEFLRDKEVEVIDDRIEKIKSIVDDNEKEEENNVEKESEEIINEQNINNEERNISEEKTNNDKEKEELTLSKENEQLVEKKEEINEEREKVDSEEILNNIKTMSDNYITYKIHIVSSTDTIESIVLKYNINIDDLKEYNDISNIKYNDKMIIPLRHE